MISTLLLSTTLLSAYVTGSAIPLGQHQHAHLGPHGGHGFLNKRQPDGQFKLFPESAPAGDMTTAKHTSLPTADVAGPAATASQLDDDTLDKMISQVSPNPVHGGVNVLPTGNPFTQTQPWNPNKSPEAPHGEGLGRGVEARVLGAGTRILKQPYTDFIDRMRTLGVPEYEPSGDVTSARRTTLPTAAEAAVGTRTSQPDNDSIQEFRETTKRTITLIIPTAPPVPVPTSPGGLLSNAAGMLARGRGQDFGQAEGEDEGIAQLAPHRTRTITLVEIPTGLAVAPEVQAPVDDGDYREIAQIAGPVDQKTRTITLIMVPTALAVSAEASEMAVDSPPAAVEQANQHGYGTAFLHATTAAMGLKQAIYDSAIWFILASFVFLMTGVAWNVYVHVGMERERKLAMGMALSEQGLAKRNDRAADFAGLPPPGERLAGSLV